MHPGSHDERPRLRVVPQEERRGSRRHQLLETFKYYFSSFFQIMSGIEPSAFPGVAWDDSQDNLLAAPLLPALNPLGGR